ncbi:hypothetical protein ACQVP2_35565 [Methylobacterium aquaticum]|uniref:hypothetical protein n=1 Tax=Methylobacterium aquaticum TaxID=270351 RepID=UPI003D185FC1
MTSINFGMLGRVGVPAIDVALIDPNKVMPMMVIATRIVILRSLRRFKEMRDTSWKAHFSRAEPKVQKASHGQ